MSWFTNLYASSIGKKLIMALTGLIIFGFAVGHMSGNLLIFLGPDVFNGYAAALKGNLPLLWVTRLTLLAAFPLHIFSAIQLKRLNAAARPSNYGEWQPQASTRSSRTMIYGGVVLLFFIVYHILHFTLHIQQPEFAALTYNLDGEQVHGAFEMVLMGFAPTGMGIFHVVLYLAAMVALCLHIYHGVWSAMQSLGLNHPKYNDLRKRVAAAFAFVLLIGFSAGPLLTIAGVTKAAGEAFTKQSVDQVDTDATVRR
jgi:succinate dehydrogenase / fumarate reductase cytochrome b subunit